PGSAAAASSGQPPQGDLGSPTARRCHMSFGLLLSPSCDSGENRVMARRVSSPQIVGREETLAALEAALGRAIEGDPAVVLLAGEAGVGKTRVARELAQRAGD